MVIRGILPATQQPSLGERLGQGIGSIANSAAGITEEYSKHKQSEKENESIKRLTGKDVSGLSPELKKVFLEKMLGQKDQETTFLAPQQALAQMESLIDQPGIGRLGSFNASDDARKNRGIFSSSQAALMPLFKSMFPRGMTEKEFKFVNDNYVPQPGDTEATIRGKIDGLRQLMASLSGKSAPEQTEKKEESSGSKWSDRNRNQDFVKMTKNGVTKMVPKSAVKTEMDHGAVVVK